VDERQYKATMRSFGRIIASGRAVTNMLVDLVWSG
jgi:hypothetical protein